MLPLGDVARVGPADADVGLVADRALRHGGAVHGLVQRGQEGRVRGGRLRQSGRGHGTSSLVIGLFPQAPEQGAAQL